MTAHQALGHSLWKKMLMLWLWSLYVLLNKSETFGPTIRPSTANGWHFSAWWTVGLVSTLVFKELSDSSSAGHTFQNISLINRPNNIMTDKDGRLIRKCFVGRLCRRRWQKVLSFFRRPGQLFKKKIKKMMMGAHWRRKDECAHSFSL